MSVNNVLFPTTVVGSLPRPKFIQDFLYNDGDPFSPFLDKAILLAISLQEEAGLDIISDGEWRRKSYIGPISYITGSFIDYPPVDGPWRYVVKEKLKHLRPGFFAKEAKWLKKNTNKKIKVSLPSPYLLGQRTWDENESSVAYKHREEYVEALITILRQELLLLKEAGIDIVQIDDPHICLFVDSENRQKFSNPDKELNYACGLINELVKDINDVELAVHLCRRNKGRKGWLAQGGYETIIEALNTLKVNQLVLEYTIPVAGDIKVLKNLEQRFKIGLGCVDCRFEHIDTKEEIIARVEQALAYIEPERILLNPDCGFAPGSERLLSLDEPYLKLKNEVLAAQFLREKYRK